MWNFSAGIRIGRFVRNCEIISFNIMLHTDCNAEQSLLIQMVGLSRLQTDMSSNSLEWLWSVISIWNSWYNTNLKSVSWTWVIDEVFAEICLISGKTALYLFNNNSAKRWHSETNQQTLSGISFHNCALLQSTFLSNVNSRWNWILSTV